MFLLLSNIVNAQPKSNSPERIIAYYAENLDKLISANKEAELRKAVNDLQNAKQRFCVGGCPSPIVNYLLGRFKCALKDNTGVVELSNCYKYMSSLLTSDLAHIEKCISNCANPAPQPSVPIPGNRSPRIRIPNKPGVQGGGSAKSNKSDSQKYLENKYRLIDTLQNYYSLTDYLARSFEKSEKDSAIRYYNSLINQKGFSNLLNKTSASDNFVLFHSKTDKGNELLQTLEMNLTYWENTLGLKRPENLIVIFLVPNSKLSKEDETEYKRKFRPKIQWPYSPSKHCPQCQQGPKPFKIKITYKYYTPLYLFKQDFLKFAHAKDGVVLNEGDVGYSNPFDNSIITMSQNYIGALNHELMHLLVFNNYPNCNLWLNEGLACLYEAAEYHKKENQLKPLNSFRLDQLKGIGLINPLSLQEILGQNWRVNDNLQLNMAVSRYICFYLESKNLLKPFLQSVISDLKEDEVMENSELLKKILYITGYSTIDNLSLDFNKFIEEQKKIALKKGELKKVYSHGTYENGSFH
ncbi:MAG: hypothetical protein IT236_05025 [Bacteroidia bacterium]|nr:hypothetical protein [Bacteroidia bacterium]